MKQIFDVTGMSCAACSARVEKCVSGLDGVSSVSVNLLKNNMSVSYDENRLSCGDIIRAVEKSGYGALARSGNAAQEIKQPDTAPAQQREMLTRLITLHAQGYESLINVEDKPKNSNLAVEM